MAEKLVFDGGRVPRLVGPERPTSGEKSFTDSLAPQGYKTVLIINMEE